MSSYTEIWQDPDNCVNGCSLHKSGCSESLDGTDIGKISMANASPWAITMVTTETGGWTLDACVKCWREVGTYNDHVIKFTLEPEPATCNGTLTE